MTINIPQEAPEEAELRRLGGNNPRYVEDHLLRWVEPIRFQMFRTRFLRPTYTQLGYVYFEKIAQSFRKELENTMGVVRVRGYIVVTVLLLANFILMGVTGLPIHVTLPICCALWAALYVVYRLYLPDRYIVVEQDSIRVRYWVEQDPTLAKYASYSSAVDKKQKPLRLRYQERWMFHSLRYCRVETVQLRRPLICMRIVHKSGAHTYIGLPSAKHTRLLLYILKKNGVEIQPEITNQTPAGMATPEEKTNKGGKMAGKK